MSLTLHVSPAPPPHLPSQAGKYFVPSLAPVGLQGRSARGETILTMDGWEMAPHTVNGERTWQVGATFAAPAGETVCVSFMMSSKGYGIVWDNPSATQFIAGINGRTAFQSRVGERVSFFVITGDTPEAIYTGYAELTGCTRTPPTVRRA